MLRNKILAVFLLIVLLFAATTITVDSNHIIDYSITLYEGGNIEVQGNISSGSDKQITFVAHTPGSLSEVLQAEIMEHLAFIDQVESTTNGTFLFRFVLNPSWKGKELQFRVGGEGVNVPLSKTVMIPDYPININSVESNSVRVGVDVYHMASPGYTSNNIIDSIIEGGNTLYFKLGDKWYNLLDSRATSAAYFKPENVIDPNTVSAWELNMWHPRDGFGSIKFDPVPLD